MGSRGRSIWTVLGRAGLLTIAALGIWAVTLLLAGEWTAEPEPAPFPAAIPGHHPVTLDPWRDLAWLQVHFDRACDAVEHVCGARFASRPEIVAPTDIEYTHLINRNATLRVEAGLDTGPVKFLSFKTVHEYRGAIGRYFDMLNTVAVLRRGIRDSVKHGADSRLHSPDVLRLVLVHEAVHALDHERFEPSWKWKHEVTIGRQFVGVVFEGHAQHVTRVVAGAWGLVPEFDLIRSLYLPDGPLRTPIALRGRIHGQHNRYIVGQAYVDEIHDRWARPGVDAMLRDPPRYRYQFENPGGWEFNYDKEGDGTGGR